MMKKQNEVAMQETVDQYLRRGGTRKEWYDARKLMAERLEG